MGQSQDKLRVAVAGCHRMTHRTPGSHNFASAFHAVQETDVVAVFDLGAETRTEFVIVGERSGAGSRAITITSRCLQKSNQIYCALPRAKRCMPIRLSWLSRRGYAAFCATSLLLLVWGRWTELSQHVERCRCFYRWTVAGCPAIAHYAS